jgi:hypothetical protein
LARSQLRELSKLVVWCVGVLGLSWVVVALSLGRYVVGCWLQILFSALRLWL